MTEPILADLGAIPALKPVVIAGPTASGKSTLALAIAKAQGRVIINADALQVWSVWRVLSARPSATEEAEVPHFLFGNKHPGDDYSVGQWLREVKTLLADHPAPVIVGGSGLYLTALTEGLADIPAIPAEIRKTADRLIAEGGAAAMAARLDPATQGLIDLRNPARIQRAWEVLATTGRGLADWQDETGPAILPQGSATLLYMKCDRDWLAARIDQRFEQMIAQGALAEVQAVLPIWQPTALWARAIGAPELVAHLLGEASIADTICAAKAASRQYAKRQRTWLRRRMTGWTALPRP